MSTLPPPADFSEESFFDFKCPYCGESSSFPNAAVAEPGECPGCGETFIVPTKGSQIASRFPIPIVTARLTLRRFQLGDIDDVARFMSEDALPEFAEMDAMNEGQVHEWVAADMKIRFTTPDKVFYFAVEHTDTHRVIGFIGLSIEQTWRKLATINVLIARDHQRRGFGTEALSAALNFCFNVRLHRVSASCDSRNNAGARMLEKAGMRFEARFREDRHDGAGWADTIWFGMIERDVAERSTNA